MLTTINGYKSTVSSDGYLEEQPAIARRSEIPEAGAACLRYLKEEELSLWDALVEASPEGSVFCRSWWLRACAEDIRVLGYFCGRNLVAGIPLYNVRRFGLSFCIMPKLTQTWGVVIEPLSGKRVSVASREMEILRVFAQHLAHEKMFYQHFHPGRSNWLPFYWNGFKQSTSFTYALDGLDRPDQIWGGMGQNIRTKIRKAQKCGLTFAPCTVDSLFDLIVRIFKKQGKNAPFSRDTLVRLYSAAKGNHAGECFAAIDTEGRVHASTFLVWDRKRTYNLAGGPDPDFRADGSQSFLAWHSIQYAAERSAVFDFAGSTLEPVESFVRAFGATQIAFNRILKFPAPIRMYLDFAGKL
jgi:Acetyltransferase (GNAT) domain